MEWRKGDEIVKDKLEDVWYSFLDNKQLYLGILLVVVVVSFYIFVKVTSYEPNRLTPDVEPNTVEEVSAMKEVTKELDNTFSRLDMIDITVSEEYPAYEVYLYLKEPFIDQFELEEKLKDYIDIFKWKTNDTLSGLKIYIYDRKEVYDKDLKPRATVYFSEELTEEDLTDEEDGGERELGEDTNEMNFQDTIGREDDPDYEEYDLIVREFDQMKYKDGVEPLTDQEFSFYLKMDMYSTLLGGSRYGGARTYLQWDLGKDVYKDGIVSIEKEFEEFKDRHLELNGQVTYYDNEYLLKQEMVIDNPQFLLFVTEDEIEEDPLEAQKRLLELNEDLYKRPLEEYVEDKSNDLSEEFEGEGTEEGTNGENGNEEDSDEEDESDYEIENDGEEGEGTDYEVETGEEETDEEEE